MRMTLRLVMTVARLSIVVAALGPILASAALAAEQNVLRGTLENGLRVVIVRNTLAPAVAVELNYLVGSAEAPQGFPGMAHAQEHMMFRGSPGLSAEQLSTIMAALGGESNADTTQVVTQYTATVAKGDLVAVLQVEADRMGGILDSAEAWREERGAIEQEVEQDLSNPEYRAYVQLLQKLFAGTPYEHDALGTRASFDRTTAAMLQKFHREWYAPNNAVLVLVGDVDARATMKKVRSIFGKIPARPLPARPRVKLQPLKPAQLELESDLPYGLALVAYRLPGYRSGDFAASVVLADVLGSQRADLYALVPEGKALATDFDAMTLPDGAAGIASAAYPQGGEGKVLVGRLQKVVAGLLEKGVSPELVAAAKRHELAQLAFQKDSIAGLASAWSRAVAVEGRSSPEDDAKAIEKVTVEDVNRVARSWLRNDTAISVLLVPRPSGKPVEAKGFTRGKESFVAKSVKPVRLPPWAAKLTRSLPSEVALQQPAQFRLGNGLRLLVIPSSTSDAVGVYGAVKNSRYLQAPPGKEGVDQVLSSLFSYGSTRHDRLAFQKELDDIAAEESAGTSFSLRVMKGHFDRGVELLAENLLTPAFPEAAFKVVQTETAAAVAGELESPAWLTRHALERGLYPKGDPKLRHATAESVSALTVQDVKSYHRSVFRPDLTTIVVIGAVTPAEARKSIERYFGAWRAEGAQPATDLPPVPPNPATVLTVPDRSRTQDQVTLAETIFPTRSHPDYYPLHVGLRVLSGGFYASRLYRDLRERTGLVYTVEAFLEAGKTRSIFGVYYACDPQSVEMARHLVERNLFEMQRSPVSSAELLQAKTILLREMLLERTSASGIADQLLQLVLVGLPVDEPERAARRYRSTTAQEVQKVFSRWVRPASFVEVVRGPSPK